MIKLNYMHDLGRLVKSVIFSSFVSFTDLIRRLEEVRIGTEEIMTKQKDYD